MTAAARMKAERCFALARSTSFAGERDNAIAQGTRIAESANLSLDLFDIPGRERDAAPKPEPRKATTGAASYSAFHEFGRRGGSARGFGFDTTGTADDLSDVFRMMAEQMARERKEAFDRARREQRRANDPLIDLMATYLREQGAKVVLTSSEPRAWHVKVGNMAFKPMNDAELMRLAEDVRKASEARERKRQYEAGRQPERCARCGSLITVGVRHECPTFGNGTRKCPGGCGKTILFGDSCVDCDRRGFS